MFIRPPLPASEGDALQVGPSRGGASHLQPLQVVLDVSERAGHTGVHAGGALEGTGGPQVSQA